MQKKTAKFSAIFNENFEIRERCKGVHCVDLGESFPTSIYLQNLASIQPRTSPVKFARSPRTDPPGMVEARLMGTAATRRTWGICTRRAGKLYRARSRLYRRRFLQVNTRWKALAEIYTMHSFAPFSMLKIFVKNR